MLANQDLYFIKDILIVDCSFKMNHDVLIWNLQCIFDHQCNLQITKSQFAYYQAFVGLNLEIEAYSLLKISLKSLIINSFKPYDNELVYYQDQNYSIQLIHSQVRTVHLYHYLIDYPLFKYFLFFIYYYCPYLILRNLFY